MAIRKALEHYYVDDLGAWQNLDEAYLVLVSLLMANGNGNNKTIILSIECP